MTTKQKTTHKRLVWSMFAIGTIVSVATTGIAGLVVCMLIGTIISNNLDNQ